MNLDKTRFGKIWVDRVKYSHDIFIFPNGTIEKRDKENSPRIDGHRSFSEWELNRILEPNPEVLIIGMGQSGVLPFTDDVKEMLVKISSEVNYIELFTYLCREKGKISAQIIMENLRKGEIIEFVLVHENISILA
jgi:hypothetical protein